MTSDKFIEMAKRACGSNTLYIKGCFGAPMTEYNKKRYVNNTAYNAAPARKKLIEAATPDTFGFDCVCLIKGILWGWTGDTSKIYGGADYKSNGVPDFPVDSSKDTKGMLDYCTDVSDDFTKIVPGEVLHNPGHVGIYIGDGVAIEATARWKDGVQRVAVANLGPNKTCLNNRTWQTHGKLQFVEYKTPVKVPTYTVHLQQVKRGVDGPSTALVQNLLNVYMDAGLEVTGFCDIFTMKAIKAYQTLYGLQADGVVGTKTWSKLLEMEVVMDP